MVETAIFGTKISFDGFVWTVVTLARAAMSSDFGNPLRKFKLVFLGEHNGEFTMTIGRHMQK